MKKALLLLCVSLLLNFTLKAQAPQGFNYQAVARNTTGIAITNQNIGLEISLRQGSATGTIVYTETFNTTSNNIGLINVVVGTGTVTAGTFNTINWASGVYFIETSMDVTGGTSYALMGTQQLMSVPYALYALSSGGTVGATGATGNNGTNGVDGATGATGTAGTNGNNGTNGIDGATGATGTAGTNGNNGTNGIDGATGATGTAGTNGNNGTNGIDGATGATGTAGTNGNNGTNGIDGATGATGTAGTNGNNGTNGIDGATGATGNNGTNGLAGATGATGATINYTSGTGIDITGTTITNTSPDQTVSISGTGGTSVTGTYPTFTISSATPNIIIAGTVDGGFSPLIISGTGFTVSHVSTGRYHITYTTPFSSLPTVTCSGYYSVPGDAANSIDYMIKATSSTTTGFEVYTGVGSGWLDNVDFSFIVFK